MVILDTTSYEEEVYRQLRNVMLYAPLKEDPSNHVANMIRVTIMETMVMGIITEKPVNF